MIDNHIEIANFSCVHSFWKYITQNNKWYNNIAPSHIIDLKPHLENIAPLLIAETNKIRWEMNFTFNEYWDVINWDNLVVEINQCHQLKQYCSYCKSEIQLMHRYPKALCKKCIKEIHCIEGKKLEFFNVDFSGGCQGFYKGSNQTKKYNSDKCFIGNTTFVAKEHRFGGIVVQLNE